MVYATRSKAIDKDTPTTAKAHTIIELVSTKHTLPKKTSSAISKKTSTATKTHTISTNDGHRSQLKDVKEHHTLEEDGQDRRHIWYRDFNENDDPAHHNHSDEGTTTRQVHQLSRRDVAAALQQGIPASHGAVPKSPVDHHHIRYTSDDDLTNVMDVDRHSQQPTNLSNSSDGSSDKGTRHARHRHGDSRPGSSRTSFSSTVVTKDSSKSAPGKGVSHTGSTQSSIPMHFVDSTVVNRAGQHAVTNHYKDSDSNTITTTTTTTHSNAELLAKQRERLERHEAATRRITQKSLLDREKAHEAILSLDHDVILLQKLLQEKEDALRAAEVRAVEFQEVTIRTETLTREIHELETTIRDLRTNLHTKEEALKESQQQYAADRLEGQKQQKLLEQEISELNVNLKAKEHVQEQSLHLQKDLDETNKQRARLLVQIREISESLKERETNLMGAHATIKGLEHSNRAHSEETLRLAEKLGLLKKRLASHEHELKDCYRELKALKGAQEKVHTLNLYIKELRDQIMERDATIKDLERDNKALNAQSIRADKLMDEIRILKDDLADHEDQLSKALKSVKSLTTYKERALALEDEVKDLRDQVDVQEKHLTYLEDALEAHENCAFEAKQLQDQIDMLENLLHEKEGEVAQLQKANKGLAIKDAKIETLQTEIQTILHEMEAKDNAALKLREKADYDLAKVNSTASTLRTEVEGLRQELKDKNNELEHAHKTLDELKDEKDRNMHLTIEITKLEKIIADKDRQVNDLEKIFESMKAHADRAGRLDGEVKELQREVHHGKKAADQAAKDLTAVSSTANTLRVEVESLREQLHGKEKELAYADKLSKDLEKKTHLVKELLTKINGLETSQQNYVIRAQKAEDKSKGLEADITVLEARIGGLQHTLKEKEAGLQAALDKANKDHDSALLRLEETRTTVTNLKKQLNDAEKDAGHQLRARDDQIHVLKNEIKQWENHEEGWVNKTTDLTEEVKKGADLVRHKDKAIHDLRHKIQGHNAEIGRLNDALNQARGELHEDRKRRASEIEDKVTEKTHHFHQDKAVLEKTISDLEHDIKHLEKKIRLDHDYALLERQQGEQIRELTLWKQNSIEQTKEWETTVANLEREKELQVGMLTRYESQIHTLQSQVDELNERIHSLTIQIETLEASRDELHREARAKDTHITELEERLRGELSSYKARLADTRRELTTKDKRIDVLNARIAEFTRQMADLEFRVAQDKDSMAAMESTLDKLHHTLAAQMDRYKTLDSKYQTALQTQADQDKQLYKLEKTLDRVTAEDADKVKTLEFKNRHLEKELNKALKRVDNLQVELHNVTRQYHDILALIEDSKAKMAKMVPAEQASHDTCSARIRSGEKEVVRLSSKIEDLKSQVDRMSKDQAFRDSAWALAENGYKDRIHQLTKSQTTLELQVRDAQNARDLEKAAHDQDLLRAKREKEKQEEMIQSLRRTQKQMQKEFITMETHMRHEMSATKDFTDLLGKLKASIKRDSEAELRSLDELEKELKSRESVVEETILLTRSRMDSGAFLESREWKSPIDVTFITSSTATQSNLRKNETTGDLFWAEINKDTNGRQTIQHRSAATGHTTELTPEPFIARTRVHEYGGAVFSLGSNFVVSSNDADCRLYKIDVASKEATPLTPENKDWRYADIEIHPSEKFLICVREDHTVDTPQTVVNTLVVVRLDTKEPNVEVLVEGADFYSAPRFNPVQPTEFAYYSWNHPFMTWDHTQLYYGHLEISGEKVKVASQVLLGGADKTQEESINQPRFAADGTLYFINDKTGFWNLYSYKAGKEVELVLQEPFQAEFQGSAWVFGARSYYPLKSDPTKIAASYIKDGLSHLAVIDTKTKTLKDVPLDFQTTGNLDAYALYYPPTNADYVAPEGTLPPLRVLSHGGPTVAFESNLNWNINYFTSRGFGVVAVNYGGSTNYGREYRSRLRTKWGIVDVDDCCNAATYLVQRGDVDPEKLAIVGGSAGGYSTLACLAFKDVFKAGVSHYGIGDLETLAKDTHKFELLYPESLIGPYPKAKALY
ncbi:Dipeptidyl aminopeptidase, partial [Linnemannia schmuckeri]